MKARSIITACSLGNFLEWYDYAVYGYLTSILARVFFPGNDIHSLLDTLLVFAIGFFARPLGSLIFGWIGDKWGRRESLIYSIIFMTLPTAFMAILPTYAQIGFSAVIALTILRLIQGIPVGGETAGVMCYLTEIAPPGQKAYFGSWSVFGSQIGFVISSLEIYFFEKSMDPIFFAKWGWRLSFIFGAMLGLLACYLRVRLHETHAFQEVVNSHHILKNPVTALFKNYKIRVLYVFFLSCVTSGAFYIIYFFSVFFLTDVMKLDFYKTLLTNAAILTLSSVCLPLFGKLANRWGIKKPFIISSLATILLPYFMFYFASQKDIFFTFLFYIILVLFLTVNYALLPTLISKLFPTPVRFTGVGIGYNASNAIFGGPAPFLCLFLIKLTGSNLAPAFYFIFLGAINLIPFLIKDPVINNID